MKIQDNLRRNGINFEVEACTEAGVVRLFFGVDEYSADGYEFSIADAKAIAEKVFRAARIAEDNGAVEVREK